MDIKSNMGFILVAAAVVASAAVGTAQKKKRTREFFREMGAADPWRGSGNRFGSACDCGMGSANRKGRKPKGSRCCSCAKKW